MKWREAEETNVLGVRVINAARLSTKRVGSVCDVVAFCFKSGESEMFSALLGAILFAVGGPSTRDPPSSLYPNDAREPLISRMSRRDSEAGEYTQNVHIRLGCLLLGQ